MNPKVVRVLTRLGAGGPPIHAILLTREMKKLGYECVLVTGQCDAADGNMSYLLQESDSVEWIDDMSRTLSPWHDLRALLRLYLYLRKAQPAIVHTHTAKAGALGRIAARLAGVPVVVHTFHGNVLDQYFSAPANWAIRMLERTLAGLTDCICVLCPQQAQEMTERYRITSREKVRVVPLGMDLQPFRAIGRPPKDEPLTVGWLGRLVPIKNVPLLLDVARETLRRTERVRFAVAGDGPESAAVEVLAKTLGPDRFEWLGWQQDVKPMLARCHLLIQTSRNEGTPVALIQGMAAGRPFLSTPAGGVVDMVAGDVRRTDNGCRWYDNGILAEPDPAAFATALCELAGNPDQLSSMGCHAAWYAAQTYALPALLGSLDTLYTELLSRKSRRAPVGFATTQ